MRGGECLAGAAELYGTIKRRNAGSMCEAMLCYHLTMPSTILPTQLLALLQAYILANYHAWFGFADGYKLQIKRYNEFDGLSPNIVAVQSSLTCHSPNPCHQLPTTNMWSVWEVQSHLRARERRSGARLGGMSVSAM